MFQDVYFPPKTEKWKRKWLEWKLENFGQVGLKTGTENILAKINEGKQLVT